MPSALAQSDDNGGAGGWTSAKAYLEICATLARGGVTASGERILQSNTVQELFKDQLSPMGVSAPTRVESSVPIAIYDGPVLDR